MTTREKCALEEAHRIADMIDGAVVRPSSDFYLEDHMVEIPGTAYHLSVGCESDWDTYGCLLLKPYFNVVEELDNGLFKMQFFNYRQEAVEALPGEWI